MKTKSISLITAAFLMSACGSPQLKEFSDGNVKWDNAYAFNQVPEDKRARGEQICSRLGQEAVGYHAKAKDLEGKVFAGGGYHCKETEKSREMQQASAADAQAILASGGDLSMEMVATAAGNDGYTVMDGVVYENN